MANKHTRELRELGTPELRQRLQEAETGLMGVRFGLATHQTQNTAGLKEARKQISRIKEILNEREREA
ncbi:MAG TPA: 50S ribosomal protein L29 [Chloroflexota bacterium]|nr:50S ribosomal protein L29 [Chloroflexota bacterium]